MKHALRTFIALTPILATAVDTSSGSTAAQSCATLTSLHLPDTAIILAQPVPAGTFTPPRPFPAAGPRGGLPVVAVTALPDFCRVAGVIRPSKDSDIKFEVWMPTSDWNGKFMGVGNGGFSGSINYPLMGDPLSRHYATASTDRGHEGGGLDASFALGHPEKLIDFAHRAVHEMTMKSKSIAAAYYGQSPTTAVPLPP
jgi:feruloyl esterase